LYQGAVDATSINAFDSNLERLRYTKMDFSLLRVGIFSGMELELNLQNVM